MPYNHTPRPKIEKYRSQEQWEENTLPEVEDQILPASTLQAPISQINQENRLREESSSSIKNAKEFVIYQKKQKTRPNVTTIQGQKEPIFINLDDSHVSTRSQENVLNTPSSSSNSQNLLEITQSTGVSEQDEPNILSNFMEIK